MFKCKSGSIPHANTQWLTVYMSLTAQSKWQEAEHLLENLPEQVPDWMTHPYRYTWLYMYAGDFKKAYETLLNWRPQTIDRES